LEQEYLPLWNERFTVKPASEADAHRPLRKQHELASILSHVEERVIGQDTTIRYGGKIYQVALEQIKAGLKGQPVKSGGATGWQPGGAMEWQAAADHGVQRSCASRCGKAGGEEGWRKKSGKGGNPRWGRTSRYLKAHWVAHRAPCAGYHPEAARSR